jgi:DNA modification methylase
MNRTMIDIGTLKNIPIEDIEVGERARQEMGDLEGLEGSMRALGMCQPICVKEQPTCDQPYLLLGGERRLGVLLKNGNGLVPCRIYPETISEQEVLNIELAENFWRKDWEYWEYDSLVARIHAGQQEVHGEKISTAPDAEGWGMQETGSMMGVTKQSVSTAIKRNKARDAFPQLFDGCKTQKDASKVLTKLSEHVIKDEISNKIKAQKVGSTLSRMMNNYITGSVFDHLSELPDNSCHLTEIDPPYAIALEATKRSEGESKYAMDQYSEVAADIFMDGEEGSTWLGMNLLLKECYRIMTEHSWLVCWFAPEPWSEIIYQAIIDAGFSTTRMWGIWTKPGTSGQCMSPNTRLANCYETFYYAWKGKPALAKPGSNNEFQHPVVPAQSKTHPTERPVSLMKEIYETFTWTGSRIFIPFLGSGNGLFAAEELAMEGLGYDLSKAHKDSFIVKASAKYEPM